LKSHRTIAYGAAGEAPAGKWLREIKKKTRMGIETSRRLDLLDIIQPEPLEARHLADVAELHYRQLSWSFNGHYGKQHVLDLYVALGQSPHFFGYVYYNRGQLLGFVTATSDFRETRRHIMRVYTSKIGQTLMIFLRHPRFFLTALESKFVVPLVFRRFGTTSEWLTFVTDTERNYLAPLVALRLIDVLREHFRRLGVRAYMAQGFKNNPKAMRLYDKLRWQVVSHLLMHNIYWYPTDDTVVLADRSAARK
jgi:hypothetical protein